MAEAARQEAQESSEALALVPQFDPVGIIEGTAGWTLNDAVKKQRAGSCHEDVLTISTNIVRGVTISASIEWPQR